MRKIKLSMKAYNDTKFYSTDDALYELNFINGLLKSYLDQSWTIKSNNSEGDNQNYELTKGPGEGCRANLLYEKLKGKGSITYHLRHQAETPTRSRVEYYIVTKKDNSEYYDVHHFDSSSEKFKD